MDSDEAWKRELKALKEITPPYDASDPFDWRE